MLNINIKIKFNVHWSFIQSFLISHIVIIMLIVILMLYNFMLTYSYYEYYQI